MTWDLWTFLFGLVGALSVVIPAVVGVVVWVTRHVRSLSMFSDERLTTFLDDWCGEPARPGFPARPGIPERLEKVEEGQAALLERLSTVEADTKQLQRNGGAHLADSVARIERLLQSQGRQT